MAEIYSIDVIAISLLWNRFTQFPKRHKYTLYTLHLLLILDDL